MALNSITTLVEALGTYEFGDPAYPDMKGAIIVRNGDTLYNSGSKQPSNP